MNDNFDKLIQDPTQPKAVPEKKTGRARRGMLTFVVVLCVLTLLVCAAAVWGYVISVDGRNFSNVYIDGVFVGGLTEEESLLALEQAGWGGEDSRSLAVSLPAGVGFTVDAVRAGAALDREQAVAAAHRYGRGGGVFSCLYRYLFSHISAYDVCQAEQPLDREYLLHCIESGQTRLNNRLARTAWAADLGSAKLVLLKGAGGVELDTDALEQAVVEALRSGKTELRFDALRAEPAAPDFDALLAELSVEPEDAYFTEEFEVVPEVVGCEFDVAEALRIWQETPLGEQAVVPLTLLQPEVTAASLEAMLYRDVLGVQTTYYTWSTADRIHNIRLAAEKINGVVLLPGESFSYNDTVGQRTVEAGFRIAKAYSDGEEVDALGGGICQVSSTLYCATMYAQLKTLSRTNHYFKVGYLDYGLDATVSWGQPDFRFRNNRDYPIMIQAYLNEDEESLTVEIWGTDMDGSSVRLRHTADAVYDEEYPEVQIGWSIHTYGDIYDINERYVDTVYENSGVYYFHKEDIEWPEGVDPYLDLPAGYANPT